MFSPQTGAPKQATITSCVMLWTLKGTFEQRVEIAARAGMQSIGLLTEHATWSEAEAEAKRKLVRSFNLAIATVAAALDPREDLLARATKAIDWARRLEVPHIIVTSGNADPGRPYKEQYATTVANMKRAAEAASKSEATLLIEPRNAKVDHKAEFLTTCTEGVRLVKDINSPFVKLLFDIYHEQVQTGDVTRTLEQALPYTAMFHVAGNPGRGEPETGEINYPHLYKTIQKGSYSGHIGMEYIPVGDPVASLKTAVDRMRASVRS